MAGTGEAAGADVFENDWRARWGERERALPIIWGEEGRGLGAPERGERERERERNINVQETTERHR